MKPDRIHALVDQLLARDNCLRPLAFLELCRRLPPDRLREWQAGQLAFLEDGLAGNPEQSVEMLRIAADWARKLGLRREVAAALPGQPRLFRNASDERLARTTWHRPEPSPQGDLFFDNCFAQARTRLGRALLEADVAKAEQYLAEMARAEPNNAVQADAEHLVGALDRLDRPVDDPAGLLDFLDADLAPRARRFLSANDGDRYLERFWRYLAQALEGRDFDPARPELHSGPLLARAGDWQAVIESIQAQDDWAEQDSLAAHLASAGLIAGQRETGLAALCQLCWRHPRAAERWLDRCEDVELTRRVERYWDLEDPLSIELFPAWLAMVGYAMPDITPPDHPAARALPRMKALRQNPDSQNLRAWFQAHQPELLRLWLER